MSDWNTFFYLKNQLLENTKIVDLKLGMEILNQKAILLAKEEFLEKALRIFLANKHEMEKNKETNDRFYLETLLHIAVLQTIATHFEKVKSTIE